MGGVAFIPPPGTERDFPLPLLNHETLFPEIRTFEGSLFLSSASGADFILLGEMADWLTREAEVSKMTLSEFVDYFFRMKIRNRLETSSDQS